MDKKRVKTFKNLAAKGKTSTGWFFGLKLDVIFNTFGEIVRLTITPGNTHDITPVRNMMKGIAAKLIGDKAYISKALFDDLFQHGTTLITKVDVLLNSCVSYI